MAILGWSLIGAGVVLTLGVVVVKVRERQYPEPPRVRAPETSRPGAHRAATAASWIAANPYEREGGQ